MPSYIPNSVPTAPIEGIDLIGLQGGEKTNFVPKAIATGKFVPKANPAKEFSRVAREWANFGSSSLRRSSCIFGVIAAKLAGYPLFNKSHRSAISRWRFLIGVFMFCVIYTNEALGSGVISSAEGRAPDRTRLISVLNVAEKVVRTFVPITDIGHPSPVSNHLQHVSVFDRQNFRWLGQSGFSMPINDHIHSLTIRKGGGEHPSDLGKRGIALQYRSSTTTNIRDHELNPSSQPYSGHMVFSSSVKRYATDYQLGPMRSQILPLLKALLLFSEISLPTSQNNLFFGKREGSLCFVSLSHGSISRVLGQPIGSPPQASSEKGESARHKDKSVGRVGESSRLARALCPVLLFLCGLLLAVWGGEYLYRDRELVAATLYCLGLLLLVISIRMWATS